ncbi:DUF3558 domain-containing protein [Streptomyces roseirectus]|uniref:DUF3558 domain-containing protein n=1 Tax=Streptomyces roseirectus TaxID=2768066 RepID=A0A7H0ISP3_9ACTN|nr:DUF3558 domain-containing protein [Streptomyces roseirectus]QNP75809.1 DUF3558 domain-containing protein [Streptomyces roseirectus]
MQRRAQRDDQPEKRTKRARSVNRAMVAAALPVLLFAAACSSDSDDGGAAAANKDTQQSSGSGAASPGEEVSASPTLRAAVYQSLPDACEVVSEDTLDDTVPKAKSGKKSASGEAGTRSGCTWDSLTDNGVKGSQYRWLSVSLLRFDSNSVAGDADQQAQDYYGRQLNDAKSVQGATNVKSAAATGIGDAATAIRYDQKKKEGSFKQQTVVTRTENIVITVDYNGAGFAGDKAPDPDDLMKLAQQVAKETVAAVKKANGAATQPSSPAATPSANASTAPSATPSPSKS